jgi:hypothetical protein
MLPLRGQLASLYVDKSNQKWVVQDPDGDFWVLPCSENAWDHREPFDPSTAGIDLELIPGHYKSMFDLPF